MRKARAPANASARPGLPLTQPGDPLEQEADQIAERVVANRPVNPWQTLFTGEAMVSRQANLEEELPSVPQDEEDVSEADESGMPKRVAGATGPSHAPFRPPTEGGASLAPEVRQHMEGSIGFDFGKVRVHTDSAADTSARQINALAYTVRQDVYFASGQYQPETTAGQRLLAHELAHVAQQSSASGAPVIARKCPQGKQANVTHDDCAHSGPADKKNYITDLAVSLPGRTVKATWSGGGTNSWECTPNPGKTPKGDDVVGMKCSVDHTNYKKDGMAWFTGFKSHGYVIGFHDSQPIGAKYKSHGCVRVHCGNAQTINENTWSGKTRINVK